jgi:hypothetical protein
VRHEDTQQRDAFRTALIVAVLQLLILTHGPERVTAVYTLEPDTPNSARDVAIGWCYQCLQILVLGLRSRQTSISFVSSDCLLRGLEVPPSPELCRAAKVTAKKYNPLPSSAPAYDLAIQSPSDSISTSDIANTTFAPFSTREPLPSDPMAAPPAYSPPALHRHLNVNDLEAQYSLDCQQI